MYFVFYSLSVIPQNEHTESIQANVCHTRHAYSSPMRDGDLLPGLKESFFETVQKKFSIYLLPLEEVICRLLTISCFAREWQFPMTSLCQCVPGRLFYHPLLPLFVIRAGHNREKPILILSDDVPAKINFRYGHSHPRMSLLFL